MARLQTRTVQEFNIAVLISCGKEEV